MDAALAPPLFVPARNGLPVLLSIPHSGRDYPPWLLAEANGGRKALATLEDPLVDRLAWRAIAAGFGAVIARTPRAAIDCNRAEEEVDPASLADLASAPVGPRARHGLGIVPSRTARHGRLWKHPIAPARFTARLEAVHRPYHQLVARELNALQEAHGIVLLLDLHSMPPRGADAAKVVIGNRRGASSDDWIARQAVEIVEGLDFRAALNDPYAGAFTVEHHGRPRKGIQALQIEIDRGAYLARDVMSAGSGFDRVSRLVEALASELASALMREPRAVAAE